MTYTFCLCAGRHYIPCNPSALFPTVVDPTDVDGLRNAADAAIPKDCTSLDLYITGLTVATLAVVDVCVQRNITLNALHFNRDTGDFFRQSVLKFGE